MMRGRNRGSNFGVMLLLYQVFGAIGIENIPPVTLLLVALQTIVYLRLIRLPWSHVGEVCLSLDHVFYRQDWKRRLLFAAFEHADDIHLYYNMISFIWKGRQLERIFGKFRFLYTVIVFTILTNATLLGLSYLASEYYDPSYRYQCAVGFSGVIFALKVLTNYYGSQNIQYVQGIPFPVSYAVWVELLVIQLFVPNASFIGHLAGILVGLLYIKGPLKPIMDTIENIFVPSVSYRNNYRNEYYYGYENSSNSGFTFSSPSAPPPHEFGNGYNARGTYQQPDLDDLRSRRQYRFS